MARPLRIDVLDGWYHVTSRGIERREIFREERDYEHFLELVSELPDREMKGKLQWVRTHLSIVKT